MALTLVMLNFKISAMQEHPLIVHIRTANFQAAKKEFLERKSDYLPADQISLFRNVLKASNLYKKDPQFYKVLCNFINLYQDAINGKVNTNELYLQCFTLRENR